MGKVNNTEDYAATLRTFDKVGIRNPVIRCASGEESLDYLFQRGNYAPPAAAPRPGVILLDLNMPGTDGYDVLNEIKKDKDLRMIPVVILTTSSNDEDVRRCYTAGASSYIQKPVDLDGFIQAMGRFKQYLFETAFLP